MVYKPEQNYRIILIFACLAVGIMIAGILYYDKQKTLLKSAGQNQLLSVADLKASQIAEWRRDRMSDARVIASSPFIASYVRQIASNQRTSRDEKELLGWISAIKEEYRYLGISLVDLEGKVYSSTEGSKASGSFAMDSIRTARKTGDIVLSDFHKEGDSGRPRLDLAAPVKISSENAYFLIFIIDPYIFLYPLIQSWPAPSETAETLLIEKDGDDVLYLNELRHRENTALSLRLPITDEDLPAAMAVRGHEGSVEGVDYRDTKVLAALKPIPGTPWHIVSKVDAAETYARLHEQAWAISVTVLALLAASGLGAGYFLRKQRAQYYRDKYEVQLERHKEREAVEKSLRMNQDRLETLLKLTSISASSEKETIDFALEEAVRLTGSSGGYLHFFDEDAQTIQLFTWSKEVLKTCTAAQEQHYPLDAAGVWADSARLRKPAIHNDYQGLVSKKGYPDGHFPLVRHLGVPIFDKDRIVGVTGVGNKEEPYDEFDALQITLFMNSMWAIVKQKRIETEREKLITELKNALAEVKALSGMLPICAYCKKIRDDKGYWEEVASYITKHSEVVFTHGMCPDCAKKAIEEIEKFEKSSRKTTKT